MNAQISRRSMSGTIAAVPVLLVAVLLIVATNPARADNRAVFAGNGSIYVHGGHAEIRAFNRNIDVDGSQYPSDLSTTNGSIFIGPGQNAGKVRTINGSIHIGNDAAVGPVKTVNGSISLGAGTHVKGEVRTVNGGVHLAKGVNVDGDLSNFNGWMRLVGVHISGAVKTRNGDIYVGTGSRIDGGLSVFALNYQQAPDNWLTRLLFGRDNGFFHHVPVIIIAPGAVVSGPLHFERVVRLYVSDAAKIGSIQGATPLPYSGE